jgi:hypothetical protein
MVGDIWQICNQEGNDEYDSLPITILFIQDMVYFHSVHLNKKGLILKEWVKKINIILNQK